MQVSTISSGEKMWLNVINQQARQALHARMTASVECAVSETIAKGGDAIAASSSRQLEDNSLFRRSIPPNDKNGDGNISREEYRNGLNAARDLLASLNSHSSRVRAFESQHMSIHPVAGNSDELAASA